jgi:hypothetical protein
MSNSTNWGKCQAFAELSSRSNMLGEWWQIAMSSVWALLNYGGLAALCEAAFYKNVMCLKTWIDKSM